MEKESGRDVIMKLGNMLASKKVLTIKGVALLTGLCRSQVYRLTRTNQIPYYNPSGNLCYFDKEEIEAWMKAKKVKAK